MAVPLRLLAAPAPIGVLTVISGQNADETFATCDAVIQVNGMGVLEDLGDQIGDALSVNPRIIRNMTTEVTRTSSGDGAFIVVIESDQEIADRQQRRRNRVADLGDLDFTPGQIAFMESATA